MNRTMAVMKLLPVLLVVFAVAAAACGGGSDPTPAPTQAAAQAAPGQADTPSAGTTGDGESSAMTEAPAGGVFRRLWSDPPTMDPHLTSDTTSAGIVVEIFSGLVTLDTDLKLVPDIAESWTIDNGVVYTFKLREGVTFHNGKTVTAQDFKWSMERAADPDTASPVADTYLNDLVGFDDYAEGRASEILGIKVIDDLTLQLTIKAPVAYFLAKMTYPTAFVVDRETVEAGGSDWWVDDPVGTGPFKVREYRIGDRLILERNADFYREPAKVDVVHMNLAGGQSMAMYDNDEIDITGVGLFDLDAVLDESDPRNKDLHVAPPGFDVSYIGFNPTRPPFDDVKVRQALNHAVDKDLIATEVLAGLVEPAYGVLPPGFPGYNPDHVGLRYDPELAKQLFAESKYAGDIPRIEITVPGTGGTIGLNLEVVLEMWRSTLGVEVEIVQVEWATYLKDLQENKFQAFAGLGWEADYPDPQDFLDILFHTESEINHGAYSNLEVDRILEMARVETDINRRVELYRQAEEMVVNDAAWVPLWFTGDRYVLVKPHVEGYQVTPMIVPKLSQIYLEG
jgi:oligopeptide transport system substrate-binding protein